jgi:hypothetical protein
MPDAGDPAAAVLTAMAASQPTAPPPAATGESPLATVPVPTPRPDPNAVEGMVRLASAPDVPPPPLRPGTETADPASGAVMARLDTPPTPPLPAPRPASLQVAAAPPASVPGDDAARAAGGDPEGDPSGDLEADMTMVRLDTVPAVPMPATRPVIDRETGTVLVRLDEPPVAPAPAPRPSIEQGSAAPTGVAEAGGAPDPSGSLAGSIAETLDGGDADTVLAGITGFRFTATGVPGTMRPAALAVGTPVPAEPNPVQSNPAQPALAAAPGAPGGPGEAEGPTASLDAVLQAAMALADDASAPEVLVVEPGPVRLIPPPSAPLPPVRPAAAPAGATQLATPPAVPLPRARPEPG